MTLMLLPLLAVLALPAACQEDGGYNFGQEIRQFAVAADHVYVATDDRLHQLSHDLRLTRTVSLRAVVKGAGAVPVRLTEADEGNDTFRVHVLLPFVSDGTLITCGVTSDDCGYCELLDLVNISRVLYREPVLVGPPWRSSASVAILVNVTSRNSPKSETYILTAVQQLNQSIDVGCPSDRGALNLLNTHNDQRGGIFSSSSDLSNAMVDYKGNPDVDFVDGFQVGAVIYLIFNHHNINTKEAHLLWFEGNQGKRESLKDIRGGILAATDAGKSATKVMASSLVPGATPVLWVGVFAVDGEETNTQLVLFDIGSDLEGRTDRDADFRLHREKNVSMVFSLTHTHTNASVTVCNCDTSSVENSVLLPQCKILVENTRKCTGRCNWSQRFNSAPDSSSCCADKLPILLYVIRVRLRHKIHDVHLAPAEGFQKSSPGIKSDHRYVCVAAEGSEATGSHLQAEQHDFSAGGEAQGLDGVLHRDR